MVKKTKKATKRKAPPFQVPDEFMIPVGIKATKETGRCAENWSDSEVRLYRAQLPPEYHAVPEDALRQRWGTLRKNGVDGFRVNGHGPAKGSRKKRLIPKLPPKLLKEYKEYINSEGWKTRRLKWLDYWKKCAVCSGTYKLDVHHNTYERLGHEEFTDCIVLCRHHHDLFHEDKSEKDSTPSFSLEG